jgi:hypothetical protein
MRPFTYHYKGETIESLYAPYPSNGRLEYKVKLNSDTWITIAPEQKGILKKVVWNKADSPQGIDPHPEQIQAIGKGIEAVL